MFWGRIKSREIKLTGWMGVETSRGLNRQTPEPALKQGKSARPGCEQQPEIRADIPADESSLDSRASGLNDIKHPPIYLNPIRL